jgi:hypothetical protein
MAAFIFAVCTWSNLPFMHSIVFTIALLFVLGIARPHILQFTSAMTERANAVQAQLKARLTRKPEGQS